MLELYDPDDDRWDFKIACVKCGAKDKLLYITWEEDGLIYCGDCYPGEFLPDWDL